MVIVLHSSVFVILLRKLVKILAPTTETVINIKNKKLKSCLFTEIYDKY